ATKGAAQVVADLQTKMQNLDGSSLPTEARDYLKRLYLSTLTQVQNEQNWHPVGMKRTPLSYQKEGIQFLAHHPVAILADDPGLGKTYQAVGAVQALGLKKVLWVTTASNRITVKKEILDSAVISDHHVEVVSAGSTDSRKAQLQSKNPQYWVVS